MSVVVYRDGVIASDLQLSDNGTTTAQRFVKIMKYKGELFGAVGSAHDAEEFFDWARNKVYGKYTSYFPDGPVFAEKPGEEKNYSSDLFWITKEGKVLESDTDRFPVFFETEAEYAAIGSGTLVALGALAAGASAQEAVMAACKHDAYCGIGVAYLELKGVKSDKPVIRLFEPMRLKDEPEA
jgi:20S proteasome alpha/beta subunit